MLQFALPGPHHEVIASYCVDVPKLIALVEELAKALYGLEQSDDNGRCVICRHGFSPPSKWHTGDCIVTRARALLPKDGDK
jgi:hypothetical protein